MSTNNLTVETQNGTTLTIDTSTGVEISNSDILDVAIEITEAQSDSVGFETPENLYSDEYETLPSPIPSYLTPERKGDSYFCIFMGVASQLCPVFNSPDKSKMQNVARLYAQDKDTLEYSYMMSASTVLVGNFVNLLATRQIAVGDLVRITFLGKVVFKSGNSGFSWSINKLQKK